MYRKPIAIFIVYFALSGNAAAFYPVEITSELNGLNIELTSSTVDSANDPEKITIIHLQNNTDTDVLCKTTFNAGIQQPKTVTNEVDAQTKSLARHVALRPITKMRVHVVCEPLAQAIESDGV